MSDWVEFFRILCRHRQGYSMALSLEAAVDHPGQDSIPRTLFMVPLPPGDADSLSALALEWIETEGAAPC